MPDFQLKLEAGREERKLSPAKPHPPQTSITANYAAFAAITNKDTIPTAKYIPLEDLLSLSFSFQSMESLSSYDPKTQEVFFSSLQTSQHFP